MVDSWTHMESTKCEPITGVCMGGARGGLSGVQEQSSFTGDEAPPPLPELMKLKMFKQNGSSKFSTFSNWKVKLQT